MPRKVREIMREVAADGWALVNQEGSHRQYKHPRKPGRVTIAGKPGDDLSPKTERSILRQAKIEWRKK